MTKPTKLDYAIMGLLKFGALSGYEIRMIFETSAMGNYSSSPGAIYPALKRLERLALVRKIKKTDSEKMGFVLTGEGKKTLVLWLEKPVELADLTKKLDEILLRFSFMEELVSKEFQIHFLEQFALHLRVTIKEMKTFYSAKAQSFPLNGRLAFENGIAQHEVHLSWSRRAIKEIKSTLR